MVLSSLFSSNLSAIRRKKERRVLRYRGLLQIKHQTQSYVPNTTVFGITAVETWNLVSRYAAFRTKRSKCLDKTPLWPEITCVGKGCPRQKPESV
jgi:hypothetical protein